MVRRRLTDLYKYGRSVTIEDPDGGEDFVVWVQKMNPLQHETALNDANMVRAHLMSLRRLPLDDERLALYLTEVEDQVGNDPREFLALTKEASIRMAKEDEVAAEDEWAKDNYIQSLRDSWTEGMSDRYHVDNEDEEASRIWEELKRFNDQVQVKVDADMKHVRDEVSYLSDDEVTEKILHQVIEGHANSKWIREFRRLEIFYATRVSEEEKDVLYFESVKEVQELSGEVFNLLSDAYTSLNLQPVEVKD